MNASGPDEAWETFVKVRDAIGYECYKFLAIDKQLTTPLPPPKLFHMTSSKVAQQIAASCTLWAFDSATMNDEQEVQYGRRLTLEMLRTRRSTSRYEELLATYIEDPASIPSLDFGLRQFVVSFCSNPELSTAWNSYGQEGEGAAVGFTGMVSSPDGLRNLHRVCYDPSLQLARVDKLTSMGSEVLAGYGLSSSEHHCISPLSRSGSSIRPSSMRASGGLCIPSF